MADQVPVDVPTDLEPALAQAIVANAPEAVIVADLDGRIQVWNGGAESIFGYSAQEALGQKLDLIIPEKLRARHWEGWNRVVETGVTRYSGSDLLAVPATHKDGHRLSIEFSIALLRDEAGKLTAFSTVMREVSERRNADLALRKQVAELEQRLAEAGAA